MSLEPASHQAPPIAAVVPTIGRPDTLSACLTALAGSAIRFETVVVDQGDDPVPARTLCERHGARHLHVRPAGLSRARNRGIAATAATWVFFPDDDCVPAADFAGTFLTDIARHPGAGFACGRVIDEHGTPLAPAMGDQPRAIASLGEILRTVVSAGLVVRRDVLTAIGGFDEALGVGAAYESGEESDLLARAVAAGHRGVYLPAAVVTHPEPYAVRDAAAQASRAFRYGRGWGALFAKHGLAPWRPGVLAVFAGYLARAAAGWTLAIASGRRDLAARYAASLAGRWQGFREYAGTRP